MNAKKKLHSLRLYRSFVVMLEEKNIDLEFKTEHWFYSFLCKILFIFGFNCKGFFSIQFN